MGLIYIDFLEEEAENADIPDELTDTVNEEDESPALPLYLHSSSTLFSHDDLAAIQLLLKYRTLHQLKGMEISTKYYSEGPPNSHITQGGREAEGGGVGEHKRTWGWGKSTIDTHTRRGYKERFAAPPMRQCLYFVTKLMPNITFNIEQHPI